MEATKTLKIEKFPERLLASLKAQAAHYGVSLRQLVIRTLANDDEKWKKRV